MTIRLSLLHTVCFCILLISTNSLIAQTEYRSKQSGDWTQPSTWEIKENNNWVEAKSIPSGTRINSNWTIRNGHTVVLDNTVYLTNLTLETGAVLDGSVVKVVELRIGAGSSPYSDHTFLNNDGVINSTKLGINVWTTTSTFSIKGNGISKISHLRARGGNLKPLSVIIDQDVEIAQSNTAANFTAFTGDVNNKTTDNYTFTLNEGKTVKIVGNTPFHMEKPTSTATAGSYTYNINGTLDLGKASRTTYIVPLASNKNSVITLNINGILKLGRSFNTVSNSSETAGKVVFNIKGQVDKSEAKDLNLGSVIL
jgi:hypothetical protein